MVQGARVLKGRFPWKHLVLNKVYIALKIMLLNVSWKNMVCLVLVKHLKKTCLRALQVIYRFTGVKRFI